jgi:hypothetical protein
MNIVKVIIPVVFAVAIFWILHTYAVRRARLLVRQQLESFPEQKFEDAKTIKAVPDYNLINIANNSKSTKNSANIADDKEKCEIREKPPIHSNEKHWAISC